MDNLSLINVYCLIKTIFQFEALFIEFYLIGTRTRNLSIANANITPVLNYIENLFSQYWSVTNSAV